MAFTDPRDGKVYKTVEIGEQVWMAENLNYEAEGSKCYDNNPDNGAKYGRLYKWETAMKVCPEGWHLPTNEEWDKLYRFVDGKTGKESHYSESPYESPTAGKYLKAKSSWKRRFFLIWFILSGNGTDEFGFSALAGGEGWEDEDDGFCFCCVGYGGCWWSASESDGEGAYCRFMDYGSVGALWDDSNKSELLSVRCVKD
ncbi:MAG: fibrobacter succinogenes major paralogous domain-containing protein [Candidatus Fibromonas sp.]|nr:fibrobacter succinogenes major paralogous domain-containing protein [Candidatus Fibromonas sp.]